MEKTSIVDREPARKKIYIDNRASKAIERAILFLQVIAWIPVVLGVGFALFCMLSGDTEVIVIGIVAGLCIALSSVFLFVAIAFLKGLGVITENNEYQKAEFKQRYDVRD